MALIDSLSGTFIHVPARINGCTFSISSIQTKMLQANGLVSVTKIRDVSPSKAYPLEADCELIHTTPSLFHVNVQRQEIVPTTCLLGFLDMQGTCNVHARLYRHLMK